MVTDGKVMRGSGARLVRGGKTVADCKIESLKIKKDDVKEVGYNFECGIKLETTVEIMVGDIIECIGQEQLPIMYNGRKYEF
jgi:translation initiation factor IF-2